MRLPAPKRDDRRETYECSCGREYQYEPAGWHRTYGASELTNRTQS